MENYSRIAEWPALVYFFLKIQSKIIHICSSTKYWMLQYHQLGISFTFLNFNFTFFFISIVHRYKPQTMIKKKNGNSVCSFNTDLLTLTESKRLLGKNLFKPTSFLLKIKCLHNLVQFQILHSMTKNYKNRW